MSQPPFTPSLDNSPAQVATDLHHHVKYTLGRFDDDVLSGYIKDALSLTVRDRLMERWRETKATENQKDVRKVFYLSLEFLLGRSLNNAILNLDMEASVKQALSDFSADIETIETEEKDAGLGNGGLGRLAACFMDSCASMALPVIGYGLRYEYGMFHQRFEQGFQVEQPDHWLLDGNPWEIERAEDTRTVKFFGNTQHFTDDKGQQHIHWVNTQDVLAVPFDMPIPGYKNNVVNTLRLWKSTSTDKFNLQEFNAGDYADAVAQKNLAEQITMVLYPNDSSENGKELRLRQQYFLASASLQDVIAKWQIHHANNFTDFDKFHCFQLNDTHPTLAIAELMRLLIDEHHLSWDAAWRITSSTMAYTNHTLLPEALEKWSTRLMAELLPRLLEIIYEINARFLAEVAHRWPGDTEKQQRMSIIEEGHESFVRMAYLGIIGSFSVNGVASLHSNLLTTGLFKDFFDLWPHKFNNKTNGVTPRRWLAHCNPKLSNLVTQTIGDAWRSDLNELTKLTAFIDDSEFQQRWHKVKQDNKKALIQLVKKKCQVEFSANSLFDVQVKRIHEYKRQLLNILHVIYLYDRISRGDTEGLSPRSVLLGGKAAPGYKLAKLIIKLANNVAAVVNSDSKVTPFLKLAFLPNYCVSSMEVICPATDLSEQISTAGKEASGTGNMKFMMNGALTIGTYDGANIEILDAVGVENFFLFGLRVEEIESFRHQNDPHYLIAKDEDLKRVMQLIECGHFSLFEPGLFEPLLASIRNPADPWMIAADFRAYIDMQNKVSSAYQNQEHWVKSSIYNTARSGQFSSDRTIGEYAKNIWKL